MKRDVQVGVILGVIILAIIGVFLSTRTTVKEPTIPIPESEEENQVGVLDISELPQDIQNTSQESFKEVTTTVQNTEQKESAITNIVKIQEQSVEKEDNIIEGEWTKVKEKEPLKVVTHDKKASATVEQEDWKDVVSSDIKKATLNFKIHKVQSNDDLSKIARKYYGDVSKWILIFNANQDKIQDRNSLKIGTELIIPEEKTVSQKAEIETTTPSLSQVIEIEDTKPSSKIHIVQQGDSLYGLATKYYNNGAKWDKIFDANKKILKNQKTLKIGQELLIPDI